MLKARIITATFLVISVLALILYAPPLLQSATILLICFILGYEWLKIINAKTVHKILFYDVLIFENQINLVNIHIIKIKF